MRVEILPKSVLPSIDTQLNLPSNQQIERFRLLHLSFTREVLFSPQKIKTDKVVCCIGEMLFNWAFAVTVNYTELNLMEQIWTHEKAIVIVIETPL